MFYLTNINFDLSCQKRTCNLGTCGGRSQYNDISLLQYILVQILLLLTSGGFVIRTGFSENSDHPEKDVCSCARSLTGTMPSIDFKVHYLSILYAHIAYQIQYFISNITLFYIYIYSS